jgi:hypothetical protein
MELDVLNFVDKDNNKIRLGDIVKAVKGKHKSESEYIFVFCIPQHRFGFVYKKFYDKLLENNEQGGYPFEMFPEPFVTMNPDLQFYYTPSNIKNIELLK